MISLRNLWKKSGAGNVLVLGGGSIRGLAHIGVLRAIEEKGIHIDAVVGCSMGSIIGGLYAMGFSSSGMESFVRALYRDRGGFAEYFRFKPSAMGLVDSRRIDAFLRRIFGGITFDELKIPAYFNAADISRFEYVVFHRGLVWSAIRASIAIPGLIEPVRMEGRLLVDGGVVETVPVSVARLLNPRRIIAVNVLTRREPEPVLEEAHAPEESSSSRTLIESLRGTLHDIKENNIFSISIRSLRLMQSAQIGLTHRLHSPHVWIDVSLDVDPFDFEHVDVASVIEAGYRAAREKLKDFH